MNRGGCRRWPPAREVSRILLGHREGRREERRVRPSRAKKEADPPIPPPPPPVSRKSNCTDSGSDGPAGPKACTINSPEVAG